LSVENDLEETILPMKSDVNDTSFHISDYSEDSPNPSLSQGVNNCEPEEMANDTKFIVF
jgi:hypothetical protein